MLTYLSFLCRAISAPKSPPWQYGCVRAVNNSVSIEQCLDVSCLVGDSLLKQAFSFQSLSFSHSPVPSTRESSIQTTGTSLVHQFQVMGQRDFSSVIRNLNTRTVLNYTFY